MEQVCTTVAAGNDMIDYRCRLTAAAHRAGLVVDAESLLA
jgi:hypothetical protein